MDTKRNDENLEQRHKQNKIRNYPNLTNQQLLSLIRASQIMITDLEERMLTTEKTINTLKQRNILQ